MGNFAGLLRIYHFLISWLLNFFSCLWWSAKSCQILFLNASRFKIKSKPEALSQTPEFSIPFSKRDVLSILKRKNFPNHYPEIFIACPYQHPSLFPDWFMILNHAWSSLQSISVLSICHFFKLIDYFFKSKVIALVIAFLNHSNFNHNVFIPWYRTIHFQNS